MGSCISNSRRNRVANHENTIENHKRTKVPGPILRINKRVERDRELMQIKYEKVPILHLENNNLYTNRIQMKASVFS